jgi:polysaccharide biosynthesis protein PslG
VNVRPKPSADHQRAYAGSDNPHMDRLLLRTRPRARTLVPLLAVMAAFCALTLGPASVAHAATVPPGFSGLNDWSLPSDDVMSTVADMGVRRWRAGLFWYRIERERGTLDWSEYDPLVARAARNHVSLLMVIATCPAWACADISGPPAAGPALDAQREFVRQAVARYGNGGSYWGAHPELPYQPVTDWQVWNEVNSSVYWKPRPDAAAYARFLSDEAAVIRATDPHATVVASGLTNEGDVPLADFLAQLYAQPAFKASFDVLAVHPYAGNRSGAIKLLDVTRSAAVTAGDAARRIWVTEFGWGTAGGGMPNLPSPVEQADLLRSTYDTMIGCRSRWNLDRAYWFGYRDIDPPAGEPDTPGYHTGLLDSAGRPKPSWTAMRSYGEGRSATGCPLTEAAAAPPETGIVAKRRLSRTDRARLKLVASRRGARFQCALVRARRRGHKASRLHWRRCRARYRTPRLKRGRYKLLVRAVDARGRMDRTPAAARLAVRGTRQLTLRVRVLGHKRAWQRRAR